MSSRYQSTKQIRDASNIRRAQTWIYAVPETNNNDTFIQTTTSDRLDNIANDFYADPQLWWLIAAVNGLGKGSLMVPENTKLRIPSADNIQELAIQINNIR
jgi:hypothetical protein